MVSWRIYLIQAMEQNGETLDDIVSNTMTDEQMDVKFISDYGSTEGIPFTVWTKNKVYFPVEYDGAESVGCVSRNPDGKPTEHI